MEDENEQEPVRRKKPRPPLSGLAIVASLWLWGAIFLYAPTYLDVVGSGRVPFHIVGAIALVISFAGALVELGRFWKNEGLSYWGAALVFLIPAGVLFALIQYHALSGTVGTIARVAALLLLALGGPLFFTGVPYFFWKEEQEKASQAAEGIPGEKTIEQMLARREARFTTIASIIVALLSLATAVVKIVFEFLP